MDFSIGALSRRTGVKVPTIRYYEQMGLLPAPGRTDGNQRRYGQAELDRLQFIRHARDLGLPMAAIRDLLDLAAHPDRPCAQADRIARAQLDTVRDKIARLQRLETELERIATSCDGDHSVADCQVIRALADHSLCDGDH
ncbi:MerR family transcriptional regulator [Polymorphum gilvum]|uniref:Probable transcriptional regulator n=1 Tax=Polymorphum gilvum (strain LMG 25793 / CGMCC 1.9160 / SL003B-26A1) TaxID=991905 RepID=F2IVC7_POLGS|nr:helix-turn-helix domain-containing protein [Polymorphum gilvum]ADZ72645.1 Probable transcriptional regulator [Polymorphum gilvum SL003B-26A1]